MLALAKDDQQKQTIQKLIDAINGLVEATDADKDGLEAMMKEVRNKTRELETLLPKSLIAIPASEKKAETPADTSSDALPGAGPGAGPATGPGAASGKPATPTKPAANGKKGPAKKG